MPAAFQVDNTMGAALIGSICAAMLYGVSSIQTWYYFDRYATDMWYIKYLVAGVWVFDTIHQALITHTVYYYLVTHYADPAELGKIVWSILAEVLFNSLICLLVQGFLAMRVWRMSNKNRPLTFVVVCLVLAEFVCSVAFTVKSLGLKNHTWAELGELKGLSMTVNILAAAGDALIAASLVYLLQRSRTGFKKWVHFPDLIESVLSWLITSSTFPYFPPNSIPVPVPRYLDFATFFGIRSDTMISRLIVFTVNTGLFTSICACASLVSILVWGNTLIYVAFYFSLGRLYSNSLLATLNARQEIRSLADECDTLSLSFRSGPSSFTSASKQKPTSISILIDRTHEFSRDRALTVTDSETDVQSPVTDKEDV
ncbi:hypothetical protein ONZ45_g7648 [Pleurotus djamor]|nr:hypothetical protein ONZ45_g7648 [Pleurotus djamor]